VKEKPAMPLYDYECPRCGERFEETRSLKERATAPCPKCGATAKKVLSGFFTARSVTPSRCSSSGGG